jgi:hypothetical protein
MTTTIDANMPATIVRRAAANTPAAIDRRAVRLSYGYALIAGLALGHFLLGLPVQLTDSFGNMLKLSASWSELMYGEFTQHAYLRPLLWAHLKLVYDLSGGDYFTWFRGVHVVQVLILVLLYVALVRPRTLLDAALLPFGLAVLIGMHTFAGTVREAFPINTFMTVLILCFGAALVALAPYRWWNDVLAMLLFVVAALTVETGLLVWVIFVGAALVGARGVSRAGLVGLVALLAAYFYVRFAVFSVGSPGLVERSSGFGFGVLDPDALVARFGGNPIPFYLYNVVTSAVSVLLSEPTAGVFRVTSAVLQGDVDIAMILNLIATASVTVIISVFAWRRRPAWMSRQFDRDDQLVALFAMILAANAVISYPYTKDVIMSPAGAFFAVAAFVALRNLLPALPDRLGPGTAAMAVAAALVVSGAWALRIIGTHLNLRTGAYVERNEWVYAESSLAEEGVVLSDSDRRLLRRLRDDAIFVHPPPPPLELPLRGLLGSV